MKRLFLMGLLASAAMFFACGGAQEAEKAAPPEPETKPVEASKTVAEVLTEKREASLAKATPETQEIKGKATEALNGSGIMTDALNVGGKVPLFELSDSHGHTVKMADLLAQGPVVLTYYRGHW